MATTTIAKQPAKRKAVPPRSGRVTFEEWIESGEEGYSEWVDGRVIKLSVSLMHQDIVAFIVMLLKHFAEAHDSGNVYTAPAAIRIRSRPSGREPDIMFVSSAREEAITPMYVDNHADLVVEVVGKDSRTRDRRDKFFEYAQTGVREYWMPDCDRKTAEFYRLVEGAYEAMEVDEDGVFRSEVLPGFWMRVEWLWQDPKPRVIDVLREWKLV
jgi:Uma2 family endonuclease